MKSIEMTMENRTNFPKYRTIMVNGVVYTLKHQIAKGHFGTLYEAGDSWGNPLAVKLFNSETDSVIFENEIKQLKKFASPQVVHLYEAFSHENSHYIVMERYGVAVSRLKTADIDTRIKIFMECARHMLQALHRIHQSGYLHGDINPQNILVEIKNGELRGVKICDFGFCRRTDETKKELLSVAHWMTPPELLIKGMDGLNGAMDIYHAGLTLYSLLSDEKLEYSEAEILANKPQLDAMHSSVPAVQALLPALEIDLKKRPSALELWTKLISSS